MIKNKTDFENQPSQKMLLANEKRKKRTQPFTKLVPKLQRLSFAFKIFFSLAKNIEPPAHFYILYHPDFRLSRTRRTFPTKKQKIFYIFICVRKPKRNNCRHSNQQQSPPHP